ncbi:MAG: thioredoxin domain-containing protein [Bacillota bacterium]|nr:thioredoxin domain-containing protein [Bacillota bacterium]
MSENKLINEKSPYLLQHAHNPVNWYPWGDEAFSKAKSLNLPVFLSIGYSTCHWCHVMERESFEDEEVAKVLNDNFVSIKVDREERPDIDAIYMGFCQAITGSGGWPLTIFMTPDKKPFHAGTYFPKHDAYGRPGLISLLTYISEEWRKDSSKLTVSSEHITEKVHEAVFASDSGKLNEEVLHKAYRELRQNFEPKFGGFSTSPKFPTPHVLLFLMRYWKLYNKVEALDMVEKTLAHMYKGGIFDHIGGGFSRYSTDKKWLVPHFEKMLYDNALLMMAYTEAYTITKKDLYREVVLQIGEYVLLNMVSPEGGFYSAEDADSEGVEGKFYVWSPDEVNEVLGGDDGDGSQFSNFYDITERGNFEGKSIPNLIKTDLDNLFEDTELHDELKSSINKLFIQREKRVHPFKDTKILTSWNGLMAAAFAMAGRALGINSFVDASEKAIQFILDRLIDNEGRLLARYRDGETAIKAYLDDYAFLTWSLIELYECTFNKEYLKRAVDLTEEMIRLFYDDKEGGFFLYGSDAEELLMRPKEIYDGAIPSGNSAAAYNLMRLSEMTYEDRYKEIAERTLECFGGNIDHMPSVHTLSVIALLYSMRPRNVVICGARRDTYVERAISIIDKDYNPLATIMLKEDEKQLSDINEFYNGYERLEGKTTIYVCGEIGCFEPITDPDKVAEVL